MLACDSVQDPVIRAWWPLARSLDLVRAPLATVAEHLASEIGRTIGPHRATSIEPRHLHDVFASVTTFTNFPTVFFALPARNGWTVLWNNSFQCDGYASLAYNLTRVHGVDTLHFSSSDTDGPGLAGTTFAWHPASGGGEPARTLYCASQGKRWNFHATGTPLPGEVLADYEKRVIRERMNERSMMALLATLGAEPWREAFYEFSVPAFRIDTLDVPRATITRLPSEVVQSGNPPSAANAPLNGPPSYLRGKVADPDWKGAAKHLRDGEWCGHGEPVFWIYDVRDGLHSTFSVELPVAEAPDAPIVRLTNVSGGELIAYDSRLHPANAFLRTTSIAPLERFRCPSCAATRFRVAVGFEVPVDADSEDDTTWFALALACVACDWSATAWADETA